MQYVPTFIECHNAVNFNIQQHRHCTLHILEITLPHHCGYKSSPQSLHHRGLSQLMLCNDTYNHVEEMG